MWMKVIKCSRFEMEFLSFSAMAEFSVVEMEKMIGFCMEGLFILGATVQTVGLPSGRCSFAGLRIFSFFCVLIYSCSDVFLQIPAIHKIPICIYSTKTFANHSFSVSKVGGFLLFLFVIVYL